MTITYELDLAAFEAWSGGKDTLNRVINEGKVSTLEAILEDCYPEGMTETQLNDILWFEEEWIFEMCGIRSESVIREELEEVMEEIEELKGNFADECEELRESFENATFGELESARSELWAVDYADDYAELMERKEELEEELENI